MKIKKFSLARIFYFFKLSKNSFVPMGENIDKNAEDAIEVESVEISTPEPNANDILESGESDYNNSRYQSQTNGASSRNHRNFGNFQDAQNPFGNFTVFRVPANACANGCLLILAIFILLLFIL